MFKFFVKIRVVPVTIFAAVLMLSFKVSDILGGIELNFGIFSVSTVQAQAPSAEGGDVSSKINRVVRAIKASAVSPDKANDPTLFTENDVKVLQELTTRRQFIEARFDELTLRERLLGAAEKRIDKKILEMKRLVAALQKSINTK